MFLINPLFFISNVIYIKPESSYILIEKSCWNSMVHLIFKRKKPTVHELRRLKVLLYNTYVSYTTTNRIDFNSFNKQISDMQDLGDDFTKWMSSVSPVLEVPTNTTVEVALNEETFFDDEFIYEDKSSELELSDTDISHISSVLVKKKGLEAEFLTSVNHSLARSPDHKNLVDYIGYGRLLSLFRILTSSNEVRFNNSYELKFFKFHSDLVSKSVFVNNKHFFFVCERCKSINFHERIFTARGDKFETLQSEHERMVHFFVNGVELNKATVTFDFRNYIDRGAYQLEIPQVAMNKVTDPIPVRDFIVQENMNIFLRFSCNGIDFNQMISLDIDINKLVIDCAVTKYYVEDFLISDSYRYISGVSANLVSKSLYYDRIIYETMFKTLQGFNIDTYYLVGFLNLDSRALDPSFDDWFDHFDRSVKNYQYLVDAQNVVANMFNS